MLSDLESNCWPQNWVIAAQNYCFISRDWNISG